MKRKTPTYNIELRGLNERHRRFCEEYIYDWNASRAYRIAYPNVTNATAGQNGHQLLKNTKIKTYVEEVQKDIAKYVGISRARIAREYMKLAFNTTVEGIKVQMYDKRAALDSLTKFFGYAEPEKFVGMIEHNVTINEIKTDGLSKPARELLLEISKKQLTDGVSSN